MLKVIFFINHHNRQSAKFIVIPPSRLEIVEFVMEAEIGKPIYLHVALYAEETGLDGKTTMVPFTRCQELPFQVKQSDVKFKQNKTAAFPPVGISCGNIAMVGLNVGTSKVTVTYFHDGKALEDSVPLSTHRPFQLQPKKDIILGIYLPDIMPFCQSYWFLTSITKTIKNTKRTKKNPYFYYLQ